MKIFEREKIEKKFYSQLYKLVKKSFYEDYKEKVSRKFFENSLKIFLKRFKEIFNNNFIIIKLFNNRVIGGIIFNFEKSGKIGKIGFMVVDKNFRSKGIGTSLLNEFERICKKEKVKKIIFGANSVAVEFYLKRGYKIIKEEENFGEKIFILEKTL